MIFLSETALRASRSRHMMTATAPAPAARNEPAACRRRMEKGKRHHASYFMGFRDSARTTATSISVVRVTLFLFHEKLPMPAIRPRIVVLGKLRPLLAPRDGCTTRTRQMRSDWDPRATPRPGVERRHRRLLRIGHQPVNRLLPVYVRLMLKVAADRIAHRRQQKSRDRKRKEQRQKSRRGSPTGSRSFQRSPKRRTIPSARLRACPEDKEQPNQQSRPAFWECG